VATHRKNKGIDDIRLFVEEDFATGRICAVALPLAVLKLMSDGIQVFPDKMDK
jgi:hypothetical protein